MHRARPGNAHRGRNGAQGPLASRRLIALLARLFLLTMLAMIIAVRDMRALQEKAVKEHRGLLDSTLHKIQTDAREKQRRNGGEKSRG